MKKYITATIDYLSGSYLVGRDGNLYDVVLHAPSTTFITRGIMHLSPTDAGFLYKLNRISEQDVEVILSYNFEYFLVHEDHSDSAILMNSQFSKWAELDYVPQVKRIFDKLTYSSSQPVNVDARFHQLNQKWYKWLQDNFVKLSVRNKVAEFRITSDNGYDWNDIIIDDVILSYDWRPGMKFNILKESDSGYKSYFYNASMDDILEQDNLILSSKYIDRFTGEVL